MIIGAGVSGASAAEAASREGAKIAVLEQSGSFTSLGMDCAHNRGATQTLLAPFR